MDFTCLHNRKHEVWLNRQLPDNLPCCFSYLSELHTFLFFPIVAHSSLSLTGRMGNGGHHFLSLSVQLVSLACLLTKMCVYIYVIHWDEERLSHIH